MLLPKPARQVSALHSELNFAVRVAISSLELTFEEYSQPTRQMQEHPLQKGHARGLSFQSR